MINSVGDKGQGCRDHQYAIQTIMAVKDVKVAKIKLLYEDIDGNGYSKTILFNPDPQWEDDE